MEKWDWGKTDQEKKEKKEKRETKLITSSQNDQMHFSLTFLNDFLGFIEQEW